MANSLLVAHSQTVAQALRELANKIEAGENVPRNLAVVMHTEPVYWGGAGFPPADLKYLGETIILSHRPMPPDIDAAVERFFGSRGVSPVTGAIANQRKYDELIEHINRMTPPIGACQVPAEVINADDGRSYNEVEAQAEFFRKAILSE